MDEYEQILEAIEDLKHRIGWGLVVTIIGLAVINIIVTCAILDKINLIANP